MGGVSIWHWLVVGVIVLLLFGRGKISDMMGDVAKGIKAFKKGMSEEEAAAATTPAPAQPTTAAAPVGERKAG
jgi:sec-independent protein translocase protein TatA